MLDVITEVSTTDGEYALEPQLEIKRNDYFLALTNKKRMLILKASRVSSKHVHALMPVNSVLKEVKYLITRCVKARYTPSGHYSFID